MARYSRLILLLGLMAAMACNPAKRMNQNFLYFQRGLDSIKTAELKELPIKPYDQLSIQVYSGTINQEQAALFNTPIINPVGMASSPAPYGYIVDKNGNIAVPLVGEVHVADSTMAQVKELLKKKLADYVKDVDIIVKSLGIKVNVLGEVKMPGTKLFTSQRVTLLDALGAAGDLDDYGKREDVLVLRDSGGTVKPYKVDLRNASFINSPVYQLQQNDVVYVGANNIKLKTVNVNPNFQRDLTTASTIASLVILILSLFTLFKK